MYGFGFYSQRVNNFSIFTGQFFFGGLKFRMFPIRQSYTIAFVAECNRFLHVSVDFYDADISNY